MMWAGYHEVIVTFFMNGVQGNAARPAGAPADEYTPYEKQTGGQVCVGCVCVCVCVCVFMSIYVCDCVCVCIAHLSVICTHANTHTHTHTHAHTHIQQQHTHTQVLVAMYHGPDTGDTDAHPSATPAGPVMEPGMYVYVCMDR